MHTRTLFAAITILLLFISASFAIVLAEGPPPGVDTAQRDDVVPEDDGGGASGAVDEGSERRLPDVDNAQRDDVVEEEEGATGSAANAPAPTGLTVTSDTDDSVSLSWNTVTNAGAYKVEYRRSGSISWLHAGYVYSSTSDTVDGLDCNTSYYFQVRARGDGSPYSYTYGNPSSSVSETTDACPAPAPTGLTVTSDTDDSVSLSWNPVTDAGAYKVEYRRSSSSDWLHASYVFSGVTEMVEGLECNTSYDFRVRARGDGSPYSYTYGNPSSSVSETTDAVVPGPAGFFGSDISQGASGADQPLHLQVQILVLRLSHRDPGVTVERHPAAPLAGMGKSIPSCQGEINRGFQPPPSATNGGVSSRGRKQGCFQPGSWASSPCPPAERNCSSRSSASATSGAPSWSPPTCLSTSGPRCSGRRGSPGRCWT